DCVLATSKAPKCLEASDGFREGAGAEGVCEDPPRLPNLAGIQRAVPPMSLFVKTKGARVGFGQDSLDVALAIPGEGRRHEYIQKPMHLGPRRVFLVGGRVDSANRGMESGRGLEWKPAFRAGPNKGGYIRDGGNRLGRYSASPKFRIRAGRFDLVKLLKRNLAIGRPFNPNDSLSFDYRRPSLIRIAQH